MERSIVAIETGDLSMEDEDWQGDSMASIRTALIAERTAKEAAAAAAAASGGLHPPRRATLTAVVLRSL